MRAVMPLVATVFVLLLVVSILRPSGRRPTEALLSEAASRINRQLPMVHEDMRLDHVSSPSPKTLQYDYTLLNVSTPIEGAFERMERRAKELLVEQACSTKSVRHLLNIGVTNVYSYNAVDGTFLGSIAVTKDDC